MPYIDNNHQKRLDYPELVILDLLGVLVEHDQALRGALAAAFAAHGEKIDDDVASMAIGYPGTKGIARVLKWLYPTEEPNPMSLQSIDQLANKELCRMMSFGGAIQAASGIDTLCLKWANVGVSVAATTTLNGAVVKALLSRLGWDEQPPFGFLVLAEEVVNPTPGPDMILECMRRANVQSVESVAKVASHPIGLFDAKQLGIGWSVLLDDDTLTSDQIVATSPTAIVDQATDLRKLWRYPAPKDVALEDEIARILQRS